MSLDELRRAIAALEATVTAISQIRATYESYPESALSRAEDAYLRELRDTRDSCQRALAWRLALGEEEVSS